MNFKQALIAHFSGDHVVCRYKPNPDGKWNSFSHEFRDSTIECIDNDGGTDDDYEFRLAPRTIMCNGVEVPAPENEAIESGLSYYLADPGAVDFYVVYSWTDHAVNKTHLQRGLVYLNKDDAIARAKAMLIVQEVK